MQFAFKRFASGLVKTTATTALFTTYAFASDTPQVCPINHQQQPKVCPVNHGQMTTTPPPPTISTSTTTSEQPKVCPVNHGQMTTSTTTQTISESTPQVRPVNHGQTIDIEKPMVCPVNHGKPIEKVEEEQLVCPINHIKSTQDEQPKVCPVNHGQNTTTTSSTTTHSMPKVCPVNHGQSTTTSTTSTETIESTQQLKQSQQPQPQRRVCPMAVNGNGDRYVNPTTTNNIYHQETPYDQFDINKIKYPDFVPGDLIPATGRGNSDDGSFWMNPTPEQIFRAIRRKHMDVEEEDALQIAFAHSDTVSDSWFLVKEWEKKYINNGTCKEGPMLKTFEGKYDILTPKSRLVQLIMGVKPYDRHDWIIDRCGKEVTYIIEYYDTGPNSQSIDVRPKLDSFQTAYDRIEKAIDAYKNDESWW